MSSRDDKSDLAGTLARALGELQAERPLIVVDGGASDRRAWELRRDPATGLVRGRSVTIDGPFPADAAVIEASGPSVADTLREVIADEPVLAAHELITIREDPSGRLELSALDLFPPGARRGDIVRFEVRCPAADPRGTVFATVIWSQEGPRLMSIDSMRLRPGRHLVKAELVRPGRVRFQAGAEVVAERRTWPELLDAVPERLAPPVPAHLVCAVETSGTGPLVTRRLDRLEEIVAAVRTRPLPISVIAYGPHAFEHRSRAAPVEIVIWRGDADEALAAVRELKAEGARPHGYPYAAALECVLRELTDRLSLDQPGESLVLTLGERPPHPHRVSVTGVLPCPHRIDWKAELLRLRAPLLAAVCDGEPESVDPVWRILGTDLLAGLDSLDVGNLAKTLVDRPVPYVPFPLADSSGPIAGRS